MTKAENPQDRPISYEERLERLKQSLTFDLIPLEIRDRILKLSETAFRRVLLQNTHSQGLVHVSQDRLENHIKQLDQVIELLEGEFFSAHAPSRKINIE